VKAQVHLHHAMHPAGPARARGPLNQALEGWLQAMKDQGIAAVCIRLPEGSDALSVRSAVRASHVSWPLHPVPDFARCFVSEAPAEMAFSPPQQQQLLERAEIHAGSAMDAWWQFGLRSYARVSLPVPANQLVDLFSLSVQPMDSLVIAPIAETCLQWWPELRRGLQAEISDLRTHEIKCLAFAFAGLTARETAERISVSERTVNAYLQTAMAKLGVSSKLAAVQLACWLGYL
jgi:LuxR family transcriptional regulator, quorum-sensing system regulator SolR